MLAWARPATPDDQACLHTDLACAPYSMTTHPDAPAGAVFALFVIAVSACEMAVALALVLAIYRHRKTLDPGDLNELKG